MFPTDFLGSSRFELLLCPELGVLSSFCSLMSTASTRFLASIQSFCPGYCFSVSGLMKYIPHTLLSCFSTTLYGVHCSVLLRSSKGFHNTNILMWIESSRAPATISLDFCTSSIFSAAKLFISCYFFSCSLIQPYTLTVFITCCIVYVCNLG